MITCKMMIFNCKFLDKIKFGISTASIFHDNLADFFGFEVKLMRFNVIDYEGNLPESGEESFA